MLGASITFGITIIIVVFLFLLQSNKMTNSFLLVMAQQQEYFVHHINKLEDRIQTGDAKQAAILNKEQPEPEKQKPHKVDIGTGQGLKVAKNHEPKADD
jgi:KaiC/GvpD/RAD55 family RecA-like ATPase